ncbi:MAG: DUF427 domain-containing protein [Bacteroidota bacterium]
MDKDWLQKAREHWKYKGKSRPPFAIAPKEGQRSVWDFPRPPIVENVSKRVEVFSNSVCLANTLNAKATLETSHPPTYYIPEADVDLNLLVKMENKSSFCEWKGSATYWALSSNPQAPIAWSYAKPFSEFESIKNHLAFYPQYLNCKVDGNTVIPPPGGFYAGWITSDLVGPFKGEPGTSGW